jgi:hypothetical protein
VINDLFSWPVFFAVTCAVIMAVLWFFEWIDKKNGERHDRDSTQQQ